ncbi:uncharacterized protein [Struthio camelus]|uniref:uncharacterized protein isoform X4 n=1 Tax=Struthio camelus TaxID=8801 RepID=UPI003604176F
MDVCPRGFEPHSWAICCGISEVSEVPIEHRLTRFKISVFARASSPNAHKAFAMILKYLAEYRAMEEVCLPYSLRQLVLGITEQVDGWRLWAFVCLPGDFPLSWAIQVFNKSRLVSEASGGTLLPARSHLVLSEMPWGSLPTKCLQYALPEGLGCLQVQHLIILVFSSSWVAETGLGTHV